MKQLKLFLLILLFIHSKMGMALNFHYCGDHLAEISLALNPKGCGMETSKISHSDILTFFQKSCCADEVEIFQNDGDISLIDEYGEYDFQIKDVNLNYYSKINWVNYPQIIQFHPRPPPLKKDFYRIYSSFLYYE